jgi:FKBP-type peptidyl-prolyl cis-trans isomerase
MLAGDGGLVKKVLVKGQGNDSPPQNSEVTVHYVGTLFEDGAKFDSSRCAPSCTLGSAIAACSVNRGSMECALVPQGP